MTTSDEDVRHAIAEPAFDVPRKQLLDFRSRISSTLPQDFWEHLSKIKDEYVRQDNQIGAKAAWCLEIVGHIQDKFIAAFLQLSAEDYRKAWDLLEQCETAISSLDRHFVEVRSEFGIEHAHAHTRQLQELFHLKWGFSPGVLIEEALCSICQVRRRLRHNCGHETGEMYDGELCTVVVVKGQLLHVSIVDNPAQKFSVIWPDDETQFSPLKHLADELLSPWNEWRYHKEIRRSHHPVFRNAKPSDPCPCGSDLSYNNCCMNKDTVPNFPHFRFNVSGETRGQFRNVQVYR